MNLLVEEIDNVGNGSGSKGGTCPECPGTKSLEDRITQLNNQIVELNKQITDLNTQIDETIKTMQSI